ncbi:MAG: hypothetical protein R8K22_07915 [Mariprofundaceae bacterium]
MNNNTLPWPRTITEKIISDKLGDSLDDTDLSVLSEIAHAIEAPESLHGFVVALKSFQEILPYLIEYSDEENELYSKLYSQINALGKGVFEDADDELLSSKYHSYCASNPLYSVLLRFNAFEFPDHLSQNFTALFYINYKSIYQQMSKGLRERVGLAMRSTSEGKGFSEDTFRRIYQLFDMENLNNLIASLSDIEDFLIDEIEKEGHIQLRPATKNHIRALHLFFSGGIGKKKGGGGVRRKGGGATRLPYLSNNVVILTKLGGTVDEEDENGNGLGNLLHHQDVGKEQGLTAQKLGVAPGDATSGDEAVTEEASAMQRRIKYRSSQICNGIASSNQFLPTQWSQLNAFDIYVLAKELIALSEREVDEYDIPSPLLAAAIASVFSRGNSLDYTINTRVVRKKIREASNHLLLRNKEGQWQAQWLVNSSLDMINGHKFMNEMTGFSRPVEVNKTVVLDVPYWIAQLLGAADIARSKLNLNKRQRFLFPGSKTKYFSAAKKFLGEVRKGYPACRLTLNRIEQYFVQCCMQSAKFDLAETAYTHGNINLIQETQLYYTAVAKGQVSDIYKHIWMQIEHLIQKESHAIEGKHLLSRSLQQITIGDHRNANAFLGSKITPTSKTVSGLVSYLRSNVFGARKVQMPYWKQAIAFHNAYTTYTILFLANASGYRAAQDPFPDPRFLDEKTGFLVISDKDFDDSYCTRIIWLPPECVKQMKFYQAHIESIVDRLCLINNRSFKDLYSSFNGWKSMPKKPKKKMRMDGFQMPPFLFYLSEIGNCYSVSPGELSKIIHTKFPFPINANRHYLRTELVERKCPTEIIDAFMGHWHRGREPWGQYSTLSPRGYANTIGPCLDGIIQENGWKAIEGIKA